MGWGGGGGQEEEEGEEARQEEENLAFALRIRLITVGEQLHYEQLPR